MNGNKTCVLIGGWHQSGKTALLHGRLYSSTIDIEVHKISESSVAPLKDYYYEGIQYYNDCRLIVLVRDPRVCWALSEDRIHQMHPICDTMEFVSNVLKVEREIRELEYHNIPFTLIRFEDFINNHNVYNKHLAVKKGTAEPLTRYLTKADKHDLPFLTHLCDYNYIEYIEKELKHILYIYGYDEDFHTIRNAALQYVSDNYYIQSIKDVQYLLTEKGNYVHALRLLAYSLDLDVLKKHI